MLLQLQYEVADSEKGVFRRGTVTAGNDQTVTLDQVRPTFSAAVGRAGRQHTTLALRLGPASSLNHIIN